MTWLLDLYNHLSALLDRLLSPLLPLLARFAFSAVLLGYFWSSAMTKLGPGLFGFLNPSAGAFAQIYPRAMEAVSYDASKLGLIPHLVVTAGMLAEFVLPALIVAGLFTRLAALGMIGFIAVQTATDVVGLGAKMGHWFDSASDAPIADQRTLWFFLLIVLVAKGGGRLSLDRLILRA